MYTSSIGAFTASWLFLCLIKPLYSEVIIEKSDWIPYEVNNTIHSDPIFFEEQLQSKISKLPQYIYHRNYQSNSVQSEVPSKDLYPEAYVKENVANSMSKYPLEQSYQETRIRDEEMMLKMSILEKLLSEDENDVESMNSIEDSIFAETSISEETKRVARQVRRQRPGFFYTLARVAFETFNDTRSAIKQISNIISENIVPDTTTQPPRVSSSNSLQVNNMSSTTVATSLNDQNDLSSNLTTVNVTMSPTTTTTQAPFRFTQSGLANLLSRNLRGLVRLFNIEWQDALNQSDISVREFQKNLGNQVGSFLQDNPNAF
ncbi:uncharacterized protein LOC114942629 [Nylanderia fulva]|uniref:uncharacterized protein LOC114942629 n=1 Tax=Nylanderia fulva TaxID=613905 RepID=UPI0010FAD5D1|nr:uncharacterized protein LOC114942629 [Nylanderia fulva]